MTEATDISPNSPLARTGATALLALLAAGGLLWLVTQVPPRDWPAEPATAVSFAGEHYRLPPSELEWLQTFSRLHFRGGEETAREILAATIAERLDPTFARARARLPEFADWYYSLSGEYGRLAMAALSLARLAEPGYVENRAAAMLFPDDAWALDFEQLQRSTEARLAAHREHVRAAWLAEVTRRLSAHRVPAPLPTTDSASAATLELDRLLQTLAERERVELRERVSLSAIAAAGAAAGPALWRAAAARRAAAGGRAVGGRAAARAAGRGAARVGSAAAGGAAVCAPSGPAAVACALLAGAAVWLGTDWVLLRVDEHFQRDELMAALEWSLVELRAQIERTLLDSYDELIAADYGAVQSGIEGRFVPAEAGRPAEAGQDRAGP